LKKITAFTSLLLFGLVPPAAAGNDNPQVCLETSKGNIVIELDKSKAPKTVENFLSYTKAGFYEGTVFHRVIKGFMVQGGGLTEDMQQKTTNAPVTNEADNGLKNLRGTVAMARTQDPHSATAQFFINTVDNHFLDHTAKTANGWGYCVFGRVIQGMDVVDAIENQPTTYKGMYRDVPAAAITVKRAYVVGDDAKKDN